MPFRGPMLAGVLGEKPRRPQFVRIAEVLRFAAGQINQPCLGLDRDGGLAARPRAIIERRHAAFSAILLSKPPRIYRSLKRQMNPLLMTIFMDSMV
jgi:hypothetical protein